MSRTLTRSTQVAGISRSFVPDLEIRSGGDGRTVSGIVVPFGRVARVSDGGPSYDEGFERGAFAKTIRERGDRVKLLSQHNARSNPLGRATLLREDAAGLYGEFRVSATSAGDEVLELLRDGALDSFSVGFTPFKHVKRARVTWRTEVGLREVSLVTFPAYDEALVMAVRSWDALTDEQREEAARMFAEATDLRESTHSEPDALSTPPGAAPAEEEPRVVAHSARNLHLQSRARARKEGGPLA